MLAQLTAAFVTVEDLFYRLEADDNLNRAEAILKSMAESVTEPAILARVYAELAQVEFWRYEYAPAGERLAIAAKGAKLAQRALEYDPNNLQANAWAAALMGYHGMEMGILSALHYIGRVKACAERVVALDEAYHSALGHQTLGDLNRLTPPPPLGYGDKRKSLEHLLRARELAPECPQAKLRLAELYLSQRKKDLARQQIQMVLEQDILERGPIFAAKMKNRARDLQKKL